MAAGIKLIVLDEPTRRFLNELKNLRVSTGMTKRTLSRILNLSTWAYSSYEIKRRCPSLEMLMRLVEYFGYDLSDSLNYKYYHGEIHPDEIKRDLIRYGLSYKELRRLTGSHYSIIYRSVNLKPCGSLNVIAAVLEVLKHEEEQERIREDLLSSKKKVKKCRKH